MGLLAALIRKLQIYVWGGCGCMDSVRRHPCFYIYETSYGELNATNYRSATRGLCGREARCDRPRSRREIDQAGFHGCR
ncbi:hypothetical protein PROAA_360002 [Candidatus Propionivibrio aalborgensis]|uniref:Uncharacterized protein n=1 Tax=Candidatus Propionivibrio aalborgensis TaxID=1860101 RepID=A0A1A8XZ01_9RHOO|nr:hypothetical protein PROAA_360002 [Candidatus Propionivibrio aalborgensis]